MQPLIQKSTISNTISNIVLRITIETDYEILNEITLELLPGIQSVSVPHKRLASRMQTAGRSLSTTDINIMHDLSTTR